MTKQLTFGWVRHVLGQSQNMLDLSKVVVMCVHVYACVCVYLYVRVGSVERIASLMDAVGWNVILCGERWRDQCRCVE